jgi:hypothetical protein
MRFPLVIGERLRSVARDAAILTEMVILTKGVTGRGTIRERMEGRG